MKMVKSLLLGSAAGLVAVSTGQAADLPVKAKPVEYVKICSLYGAGFYYMPGTDMCIKIGGYVRAEAGWGANGSLTWGPFNGNAQVRSTSNLVLRARGYITADAREQTAYGTARGYIAVGLVTNDVGLNTAANTFSANRAFVQWAGMTAGLSQSFFDFYSVPAVAYWGTYPASDTGDPGWLTFGYTAQLGNGISATLAAETRRTTQIINVDPHDVTANAGGAGGFFGEAGVNIGTIGTVVPGAFQSGANFDGIGSNSTTSAIFPGAGAYGGQQVPDFVGNLRIDQTWGGAQVMAALHQLNALNYGVSDTTGTANALTGGPGVGWGFAVGGGLRLNFPMIAQGDYFQTQVNYTQGALRYLFQTPNSNWGKAESSTEAFGVLSDAVYGSTTGTAATGTGLNLTTAWGFNASYEHYWTPSFHTSLYGGWYEVRYNGEANNLLCNIENGTNTAEHDNITGIGVAGCNNNWDTPFVGTRWQWDITKSFYLGVDILYQRLDSGSINSANEFLGNSTTTGRQSLAIAGSTCIAAGSVGAPCTTADIDNWAFRFRAHKDFLP
jgi:Porin subfamily